MTILRKAALMALEALEYYRSGEDYQPTPSSDAITKLRKALAQHEPEPVAWIFTWYEIAKDRHVRRIIDCEEKPKIPGYDLIPLYTAPPQRKPLTTLEIFDLWKPYEGNPFPDKYEFARAIERAHGIGSEE